MVTFDDMMRDTLELQKIRIHNLKHTFATERAELVAIEKLRALMGHESIRTTLRYKKVMSQRAEEVAQLALKNLPDLFWMISVFS